jgi:hypothetical protein
MKFVPPKFSKLSEMASINVGRLTEYAKDCFVK